MIFTLLFGIILIFIGIACLTSCNDNKIHVQDATGKDFTFDKPLTRLTGSHNPTLNAVVAVGGGGKYLCGFGYKPKAEGLYKEVINNWDELKSVYQEHDFDYDAIKESNAELAVLPESQSKRIAEFEKCGVDSFVLSPNKESLQTVKDSITRVGKLVGDEQHASEINKMYDDIINNAKNAIGQEKKNFSIMMMGASKNEVVPAKMIQDEIIEQINCVNAVTKYAEDNNIKYEDGTYAKIDASTFVAMDPNCILIPNYAKFGINDILNDPQYANMKAVKNKQVYTIPSNLEPWDYSTVSSCLAICCGAHYVYPEKFSEAQMQAACDKFYNTLYNKTFTREQLGW